MRDKRPSTVDETRLRSHARRVEGLEDVLDRPRLVAASASSRSARSTARTRSGSTSSCSPSELVFSRLRLRPAPPRAVGGTARARRTAGSTATCARPPSCASSSRSTLVFFLGVLYHSALPPAAARDAQPCHETRRRDAAADADPAGGVRALRRDDLALLADMCRAERTRRREARRLRATSARASARSTSSSTCSSRS